MKFVRELRASRRMRNVEIMVMTAFGTDEVATPCALLGAPPVTKAPAELFIEAVTHFTRKALERPHSASAEIRACAAKLSAEAKLTRAETDIFTRRLLGQTLSQIAAARRTKPSTVKTQYATLGRKLQAIHINPRLGYWALREVIGDRYDED